MHFVLDRTNHTKNMYGPFATKCRSYGTRRALHWLAYRLTCRYFIDCDITRLFWLDFSRWSRSKFHHPGFCESPFEFRMLTEYELRSHIQDVKNGISEEFLYRRLTALDHCFAAVTHSGELAGYTWYAMRSIEEEHNRGGDVNSGVAISFPHDVAFSYHGYVLPRFRGHGLFTEIKKRAPEALARLGIRKTFCTTDWTNFSALAANRAAGYEDLGLIRKWGWGSVLYTQISKRAQRLPGVRFGDAAEVVPRRLAGTDQNSESKVQTTELTRLRDEIGANRAH